MVGALQCWSGFWQFSDVLSATGCPGPDSPCHHQSWDSYQPTEGAVIPLGESPRLQLSLDVIMWEDYHQFDYPPLSDAPIGKEVRRGIYFQPLVNCYGLYLRPYPGETEHETIHPNSPTATRTSLWLSVLQYDAVQQLTFVLDGNAWAPPEWSSDNGWLQTVAVQGWAAEAKMLTPSLFPAFGSRAFNGTDRPIVSVQSVELLGARKGDCDPNEQDCGPSGYASPLVARGFSEDCGPETNSSEICVHVVVANTDKIRPAKFTLVVQLQGAYEASNVTQAATPFASSLFANGGYDVELKRILAARMLAGFSK